METNPEQAPWHRKNSEGKMFDRLECDRCRLTFHAGHGARATRVPRCPACGSLDAHPAAS